jgi:murein DD-endopeptidase MepM/ murein hydrolase activator NlpD
MGFTDRITTIVVTATVTSAAWIVAGSTLIDRAPEATPATLSAQQATPGRTRLAVLDTGRLLIPVQGLTADKLEDTFAQARAGGLRVHDAIDIMAPRGTPVIAAAAGTIERVFPSNEGGKTIYLRSSDRRTIHYYAHLDQYAPGLHEGQRVVRGQALGTVGSTGNADETAPHLHFAIMQTTPQAQWYDEGAAINPYPLLTGH